MKKHLLLIASISILFVACGRDAKPDNLSDYSSGTSDDYTYVTIDDKIFVPFTTVANSDQGDWIGIVDGDEKDRIYEYKDYSPDEWIISFYKSGEMDISMLMKEQNVTEYPEGLASEYQWDNTETEIPK